jgi:hypothetical protein
MIVAPDGAQVDAYLRKARRIADRQRRRVGRSCPLSLAGRSRLSIQGER